MWRLEAEICEHGCENLSLMGREDVSEKPVAPASCTLINEGGIFRPHYTASRPSHPSANTTNRRLPQKTVNILGSCTTVSVWAAAVCPQDIPAVTKRCATSFSSGILSGAPVMSRAHNNAPARLQVFK